MTLYSDRYTVDFQIDHTYTLGSVDNRKYDIVLNPEQLRRPNDCICLSITVYGDMPRTALLITNNYAGGTPSAVLEDDMIVILCDWQGSHYALNYDGSLLREWK